MTGYRALHSFGYILQREVTGSDATLNVLMVLGDGKTIRRKKRIKNHGEIGLEQPGDDLNQFKGWEMKNYFIFKYF